MAQLLGTLGEALARIPAIHIGLPAMPAQEVSLNGVEPSFFHDNGILLAAPKKKTSHMKRRQRLYAPGSKQIKLLHHLNRCPACGNYKRSHALCMHCVGQIRRYWKDESAKKEGEKYVEDFANPRDEKVLYPGKFESSEEEKLRKKEYLQRRPKTLPVE